MSPVRPFHRYRGLRDFTVGTLLEALYALLPEVVPPQTRYKVTDLPTERTVRYYVTRGIVDRPTGRRGTFALYGYRHLLQVLALKHLQAQYLPLRRVRSVLKGKSNRELELLLPEGRLLGRPGSKDTPSRESHVETPAPKPRPAGRASPGTQGWRRCLIAPGVELHVREDIAAAAGPGDLDSWRDALARALEGIAGDGESRGGGS